MVDRDIFEQYENPNEDESSNKPLIPHCLLINNFPEALTPMYSVACLHFKIASV